MISFNKNVYLVSGDCKDCIYDMNTGKYYQIFKKDSKNIRFCIQNNQKINSVFINKLFDLDLLIDTNKENFNDGDIKKITIPKNTLKMAWIEVTTTCNLYCRHCYEKSSFKCTKQMDLMDFKYVIDELLEIEIENIQFIGGEPLIIGEKLKDMIDYCTGKFKFIEVFTNGTLIDKDWINYFKKNNIQIALSVYSYNSFVHDFVTNSKDSHKKTIKTIGLLKENDIRYRLATVHMKNTFLGKKRNDLYELNPNRDIVRMSGRAGLSLLTPQLLEKKLITEDKFKNTISPNSFLSALKYHNCFSKKIYISCELDVYPCVMERAISHGNMKNKKLKELLNDAIFFLNKDYIEECNMCEFRYACHDCRADRLDENYYSKPWYCTYDPSKGEWTPKEEFIKNLNINNDILIPLDTLNKLKGYSLGDVVEYLEFYFQCDEIKISFNMEISDNPFAQEIIHTMTYKENNIQSMIDKKVIDIMCDETLKRFDIRITL